MTIRRRTMGQKRYHVRLAKPNLISYKEVKKMLSKSSSVTPSDVDAVIEVYTASLLTPSRMAKSVLGQTGIFRLIRALAFLQHP
jgi:hypothetical protein